MAKLLFFSTNGSENPTKAAIPFLGANGAVDAGHEAQIALFGDAVVIMRDAVRDAVVPVGWPPLREMMAKTVENRVPIYVWGGCSTARGVAESNLQGKNAQFTNPKAFAELVAAADRVVSS